jgi:hypothetical protein
MEQTRAYIRAKDTKKKQCACAGCGRKIEWNGSTCVEFGVNMCLKCRIKNYDSLGAVRVVR